MLHRHQPDSPRRQWPHPRQVGFALILLSGLVTTAAVITAAAHLLRSEAPVVAQATLPSPHSD